MNENDARPGLLVGSAPRTFGSHKEVMHYFVTNLPRAPHRGHNGPISLVGLPYRQDPSWSGEQLKYIGQLPAVDVLWRGRYPEIDRYLAAPIMRLKGYIQPNELDLGFARHTRQAYRGFTDVCEQYKLEIPLQVGVNTIDIMLLAFRFGAKKALDTFVERTRQEVEKIWNLTGGNVVFMLETPMANLLTNLTRGYKPILKWFAHAFARLVTAFPPSARWGFHFCWGRVGNSALLDSDIVASSLNLYKLYDFRWMVLLANTLHDAIAKAGRTPSFVHLPLCIGKRQPLLNPADYEVFGGLKLAKMSRYTPAPSILS
jgi:hypothetical protein